jgi:peptidoglycan hydrolase-like protein with peptidoglycan-binding domain
MTKDKDVLALQELLKEAGFDPGALDGVDGPKTQAAHKAFLAKSRPAEPVVVAQALNHWPNQREVPSFFGKHELGRDGHPTERWQTRMLTQIRLPYPMRLAWDLSVTVQRMTCHKLIARDLGAILAEILAHYGSVEAVRAARMDLFGGCYNYRAMRSGAMPSMHSWGIAIDLDPDGNPFVPERPKNPKSSMPDAVVAIFKRHGWAWGGDWNKPFDPQHFQATQKL